MLGGKEHLAAAVLLFIYKNMEEFVYLFLKILEKMHQQYFSFMSL